MHCSCKRIPLVSGNALSIMCGTYSQMTQKKRVHVYGCIYVHTHTHIYEKRVCDKAVREIFTIGQSQ